MGTKDNSDSDFLNKDVFGDTLESRYHNENDVKTVT